MVRGILMVQKHKRRALTLMTWVALVLVVNLFLVLQDATTVTAREMLHPCPAAGEDYTQEEHDNICGTHTLTLSAPTLSGQAVSATSVTLSWTAVEGASGYQLWRYYNEGLRQVGYFSGTLTATTYTDSGLTSGLTYHYHVRAKNDGGDGPWSNLLTITPSSGLTPTPTLTPTATPTPVASPLTAPTLTATAKTGEYAVELSWASVPGAMRYELMVWWHPLSDWQPIGGVSGTSYTHSGLTVGRKYYYTIRAVNAAGAKSGWQQDFASATVQ